MKNLAFILVFYAALSSITPAQQNPIIFSESNTDDLILLFNETVNIQTDTAYLIKKNNFGFYQKLKKKIISANNLAEQYFEGLNKFEKQIIERETAYNLLKARFDSLSTVSITFINTTNIKLNEINSINNSIRTDLVKSQEALNAAKSDIIKSISDGFFSRLNWGIGGAIIGLVVGVLVGISI